MPQPSPIADYTADLSRALAFDRVLARRVRDEVEDHLWAATEESGDTSTEAQRRAIARFGDPHAIATQYAPGSLYRQTKRIGTLAVLVIAGTYVTMKGRLAWYEAMHWSMGDALRAATEIAMPLLRGAFMAAIALGLVGWLYALSRKTPARLAAGHHRQLRLAQLLCAAATAAVTVSVAADVVVTAVRLAEAPWSAQALVPLGLIIAEVVFAVVLAAQLRGTIQRTTLAARHPHDEDLARPA